MLVGEEEPELQGQEPCGFELGATLSIGDDDREREETYDGQEESDAEAGGVEEDEEREAEERLQEVDEDGGGLAADELDGPVAAGEDWFDVS